MERGKPHHYGHHRQSEEEAVRDAATGDVAEERTQKLPVQEEVMEAAGGADHQFDFFVDSIAVGEAFAHALQMEELADVEVWDLVPPPRAEGPAGSQAVTHHFPAGPPVFDDDVAGAALDNTNDVHRHLVGGNIPLPRHVPTTRPRGHQQGQDVDMHEEEEPSHSYQELQAAAADLQIFAAAQTQLNSFVVDRAARAIAANNNNQQAAPAKATTNQHAGPAAAGGADRPSVPQPQERGAGHVLSSTFTWRGASARGLRRRRQQPVGGGEAITLRLETPAGAQATTSRTVPGPGAGKEGIISARQAMLADAAYSPVFLAGIEEEEHGNSWYDSLLREAQAMEAIDEPGLHDQVPFFQQQFPRFDEEPREEPGYSPPMRLRVVDPCDLDLDEAGPSTTTQRRQRVLPLAHDEVSKFDCGICMETIPILDLFHGMQCQHRFCVECMGTYIEGRINGGEVPIPCPDPACPEAYGEDIAVLHPEVCKKSIDFAAFSSWGDRLTERAIPPNLRAYCPNLQCGMLLEATGGKTLAKAFCPACSHPMCATCGFDWSHDDADGSSQHDCDEGPNAELVKKLAEERRWKQCPRCKMLVERTFGCDFMKCRYYIYSISSYLFASSYLLLFYLKLIVAS